MLKYIFIFIFINNPVFAGGFYFDIGTGYSKVNGAHSLFEDSAPELGSFSLGAKLGLFWNMTPDTSPIQLHIGISEYLITQAFAGGQYNLLSSYPMIRLEVFRFYAGAGYSKWIWSKKSGAGFSLGNAKQFDLSSLNLHGGILWKTTPNLHLALQADRDMFKNNSANFSSLQLSIQIRFYLFDIITKKDKRDIKLDGWRYPFGIESKR